jgi:RNA polymerase sigma factor (sigma-70 family)
MTGDERLLQRRLGHDLDQAFPDLVAAMHAAVYNGARRWLPARQDAEDVTQEVFVRAYQALQGYPPERIAALRLRPWLFTITLNMCRNHVRTRSRRPRQVALEVGHEVTAPDATDVAAVDAVAADEWRHRLDRLERPQRDAIVLRHVVGLGYDEIAEVLGRPAGTVKSDVHRGLARLRTMLTTEEAS